MLFRAKGDTSDAKKAFNDLEQSIKKDTRQIEKDVEDTSDGSSSSLAKLTGATTGTGAGFTALGGIVGAATVAIAAVGTVAVTVGQQLFGLAKSTAEVSAEIDKFQKLTGLTAQTISSIKFASEAAGSSLDEFEDSWEAFIELLVEGGKGAEDAKEKLVALGIDPQKGFKDLEGSLAKAMNAVGKAKDTASASALAMNAFGESGLRVIGVAKEMGGNIEAYTKKLKEMGLAVTEDAVKTGKEFNAQYKLLGATVSGMGNMMAREFMPQMTAAMRDITKGILDNAATFKRWGNEIAFTIGALRNLFSWFNSGEGQYVLYGAKLIGNLGTGGTGVIPSPLVIPQKPKSRADLIQEADTNNKDDAILSSIDVERQKELAKKQQEELKKHLALLGQANKLQLEGLRQEFDNAQQAWVDALEKGELSFEDYKQGILGNIEEFAKAVRALLKQSFDIESQGLSGQALANALKAYENALAQFNNEIKKQKEDLAKQQTETEKKTTEDRLKLAERDANRKLTISKKMNDDLQLATEEARRKSEITEVQFQEKIGNIALRRLEQEREVNQKLSEDYEKNSEKRQAVLEKLVEIDTAIARQRVENEKNVQKAIEETTIAYDDLSAAIFRGSQGAPGEEGTPAPDEGPAGGGGIFGAIDWQGEADVIAGIGDILTNTFHQIAEAVGSAVEAFVLFGSAGASFQKFAAQLIASIAKMAAIEAVWNLAQGFAKLAMAFFGHPMAGPSAAMHFKAAAIYGIISGVAAVAGRAVAGDAFKSQTSGAFGSSASSSASSGNGGDVYSSNRDKQIIAMSRNAPAAAPETNIVIRDNSGLFAEFFSVEVSRNGKVRDAIKTVTD